jgi:hypothetical protein
MEADINSTGMMATECEIDVNYNSYFMLPLYLRQHCCILSTLKMFLEKVDVPKGTAFNSNCTH